MPLYEYICRDCRSTFEKRRPFAQANVATRCAHCGSDQTDRLLATVNLSRSTAGAAPARADSIPVPVSNGGCCGGTCGCG